MSAGASDSHGDDELDPDEPRTPLWLPLVGLALFVGAAIYFVVGGPEEDPAPQAAAPPQAAEDGGAAAP